MADESPTTAPPVDPVVLSILSCREEARSAKLQRMIDSRRNRDIFLGRQDWSHKIPGQSTEFLPKTANSVEQMAAFIKRGLVRHGDWFQVQLDRTLQEEIDPDAVRNILKLFLEDLWTPNQNVSTFPLVMSDAAKQGLLESLMILKVHGGTRKKRSFRMISREAKDDQPAKREMEASEDNEWKLRIDLIPPEDYYPDPSGAGLYEIHFVERDLHEVIAMSEGDDPVYDPTVVKMLQSSFMSVEKPDDQKRQDEDRNQDEAVPAKYRKKVSITEFWGTLLNPDGSVQMENCVCTIANDRFLLRKPEPNPFWHQESPFVVAPIVRVPHSVWHRALYDNAVDLNLALNELFNLILDGGLAAVWGVRQVRIEDLDDPTEVSDGLPQGKTLKVKHTLPYGMKVAESVITGQVPNDAMAVFEFLNREYHGSVMTNEMKVGALPPKQVRATEVVEASQSQALTLDGIVTDLEDFMARVLRLAWYTILQNADSIPAEQLATATAQQYANFISQASPEERFSFFYGRGKFRVTGLSQTMARAAEFQKKVALMQVVNASPILMRAFIKKYSADQTLRTLFRDLNIDIESMQKSEAEQQETSQEMSDVLALGGQQRGQEGGVPGPQGDSQTAEINQAAATRSGLTPNA